MTGVPLYYLAGVPTERVTRETFAEHGIDEVLADAIATDDWTSMLHTARTGPDGTSGTVVAAPPYNASEQYTQLPGYYPDRQDWRELGPGVWFGTDRESPPTPDGLERTKQVGGFAHELADGNVWVCPTVRRAFFVPCVPCIQDGVFDERRRLTSLTRRVKPEWESLWNRSLVWAAKEFSGEWEPVERWAAAATCLAVNYRVGPEEITALGLFDEDAITKLLSAALDVPFLDDLVESEDPEKKRLLADIRRALASGTPGDAAYSPDTNPASPKSSP